MGFLLPIATMTGVIIVAKLLLKDVLLVVDQIIGARKNVIRISMNALQGAHRKNDPAKEAFPSFPFSARYLLVGYVDRFTNYTQSQRRSIMIKMLLFHSGNPA